MSEETRAKLRISKKGILLTQEHKDKLKVPKSEKAKDNMRSAALLRPTVVCPHCNKSGKINGMKRYHFDNCKYK